jgi:hypothetical protein
VLAAEVFVSAHLGHWYVQLAFAVPALVIIGYLLRDSVRRRLRERRGDIDPPPASVDPPPGKPG